MIDLHCLPPRRRRRALDIRDSTGIARQAANDEIEAIRATPHIHHDHDVRSHEGGRTGRGGQSPLREEGVPVSVLADGEVAATAVEVLGGEQLARVSFGQGEPKRA